VALKQSKSQSKSDLKLLFKKEEKKNQTEREQVQIHAQHTALTPKAPTILKEIPFIPVQHYRKDQLKDNESAQKDKV